MTLLARPVRQQDLQQITQFIQSADELFFAYPKATYPLTTAQLSEAIQQRYHATVIECDGVLCGFANFYRVEPQGVCAVGNVMVAPQYRGRGVGRFLITTMIELAQTHYAARELLASCFNHNTVGLLVYPKLGFVPRRIEPRLDHQGNAVALIHLSLTLASSLRPV